jgi:hypothetical protein
MRELIRERAEELWISNNPVDWAEARELERVALGPAEDLVDYNLEDWA